MSDFDLASAQPVQFDLASAKPVGETAKTTGLGFWDYLKGVPRALASVGTGAVGALAGGLSSAGSSVENAGRFVLNQFGANLPAVDEAANFQKVMGDLTYKPQSPGAQADVNAISYPSQKLGQFAQYAG